MKKTTKNTKTTYSPSLLKKAITTATAGLSGCAKAYAELTAEDFANARSGNEDSFDRDYAVKLNALANDMLAGAAKAVEKVAALQTQAEAFAAELRKDGVIQ